MDEDSGADVGAQMSAGEKAEGGGKAQARGEATGGGGHEAMVGDGRFASANGPTGAGLSVSPSQSGRFWGEIGVHSQDRLTVMSPLLGFGYKVIDQLELEIELPIAYASWDVGLFSDSALLLGDPYVGVNYLGASGKLRYKVGGGLALPIANADDGGEYFALYGSAAIRGFQEWHYWLPDTLSLYAPARIEYGDKLVFGGDMSLGIHIATGDSGNDDMELTTTLAPFIGGYLGDGRHALLGGRLAIWWWMTGDGRADNAQVALEPYFRYDWSSAFFNTRLTLNLDNPAGSSFDDGGFWGLHVGGGVKF